MNLANFRQNDEKKWPNFNQLVLDSKNGQNLTCNTAFESFGHRLSKTVLHGFLASTVWEKSLTKIGDFLTEQSVHLLQKIQMQVENGTFV